MRNVHRMSIKTEHKNLEIRKTLNDFSVQVRNLLLPLGFDIRKRDTHSFYSGLFICPPPISCGTRHRGLREQAKANRLLPRQVSSQLSDFFKISQNPPLASGLCCHSHSLASVSHLGLLWHLWVTLRPARARRNTCVNVTPEGSQPN